MFLIIIGLLLIGISYVGFSYGFAYSVHHLDSVGKCNTLYKYFLCELNKHIKDESNFTKLMIGWTWVMFSFSLSCAGLGFILIGIFS